MLGSSSGIEIIFRHLLLYQNNHINDLVLKRMVDINVRLTVQIMF